MEEATIRQTIEETLRRVALPSDAQPPRRRASPAAP
jgi:hypothetical protein